MLALPTLRHGFAAPMAGVAETPISAFGVEDEERATGVRDR